MTGHGAKLPPRKQQVIAQLLRPQSVAEAARAAGIGPQTLYRWMKEPEFDAAWRSAQRAAFRQSMARLRQGASAAAATLLKTMVAPKAKASTRQQAAQLVVNHAKEIIAIEDFAAEVAEVERNGQARARERDNDRAPGSDERGSSGRAGHGAKFPRRKEEAIAQLLKQRNVEEAARVTGISVATLYRWMKDPEFDAALRAAGRAAFGRASVQLQQGMSAAVTTMQNLLVDPATPEGVRLRTADCFLCHAKAMERADLEARVAEVEPANRSAASVERGTSKISGNLFRWLERLKAAAAARRSGVPLSPAHSQAEWKGLSLAQIIRGRPREAWQPPPGPELSWAATLPARRRAREAKEAAEGLEKRTEDMAPAELRPAA